MAPGRAERAFGLRARAFCRFVRALGELTLLGGKVAATDLLLSLGMVVSESRALLKRFGRPAQRRGQEFREVAGLTGCAIGRTLARGRLAPARRFVSAFSRLLTPLLLAEPAEPVAVPFLLLGACLTLTGQVIPPVRHRFPGVGYLLALIGDRIALIGHPVALISGALTLVGHPVAGVNRPTAFTRNGRTRGWLCQSRKMPSLVAQGGALTLERGVIPGELRRLPVDRRAAALDLNLCGFIVLAPRAEP